MDDQQLVEVALKTKDDGNAKFKAKKFKEAEGLYKEALMHIETVKNTNSEVHNLKKTLLVNMSVATNNTQDWKESIINLTRSLDEFDDKNAKALFLRSVAHFNMKNYTNACSDVKEAIKLQPEDKKLRAEFEKYKKARDEHAKSE